MYSPPVEAEEWERTDSDQFWLALGSWSAVRENKTISVSHSILVSLNTTWTWAVILIKTVSSSFAFQWTWAWTITINQQWLLFCWNSSFSHYYQVPARCEWPYLNILLQQHNVTKRIKFFKCCASFCFVLNKRTPNSDKLALLMHSQLSQRNFVRRVHYVGVSWRERGRETGRKREQRLLGRQV